MITIEHFLLELIATTYEHLGWPGVILMMAIESANIPLPSELIMPLGGWMLIQDKNLHVGFVFLAAFYGALGNLLGSLVSYYIGYKGGRPTLTKYGKYVLLSAEDLDRMDRWFSRYGDATVFFTRLMPVLRTFISFPAGIAKMNLVKFSIYTFSGSFIWSLGLAYGGFLLGENWETLRGYMRPFDIPIIVILLLFLFIFVWRRVRKLRNQNREDRDLAQPDS